jgi:ELWxxDGT repeat protein
MFAPRTDLAAKRLVAFAFTVISTALLPAVPALLLDASPASAARATLVKDIRPGHNSSILNTLLDDPGKPLTAVGRTIYFGADDGRHGYELWRSNGTARGTRMVKDIRQGPLSSQVFSLTNIAGILYFTADDGIHGAELWRSDGTAAGTRLVQDINPGPVGSAGFWLTAVGSGVFLYAFDGTHRGLWHSDGTEAGTVLVKELVNAQDLAAVGNALFFAGSANTDPLELWRSDGTTSGTGVVAASVATTPYELTDVTGTLFFAASDPAHSVELWRSDGTPGGTFLVRDINTVVPAAQSGSNPQDLTAVGSSLYLLASADGQSQQIWLSNGTGAGTLAIAPASFSSELAGFRGKLFFTRAGRLLRTEGGNGTPALRKAVDPQQLTPARRYLYFVGGRGKNLQSQLWRTKGSPKKTKRIPGTGPRGGSQLHDLSTVGDTVFFTAKDRRHGRELWRAGPPLR